MTFTVTDVESLLATLRRHRGDSTTVEVKRATEYLPESMGSTVCAFANMPDGGTVILGVTEASDFAITGVRDPAATEAALVSVARQAVDPPPFIETHTVDVEGLSVVVGQVAGLSTAMKPARFKGRAYLRQADGDYVMGPADLHMIEVAKLHETERAQYDAAVISGSTAEDFDPTLVAQLVTSARTASSRLRGRPDEVVLRQLGATVASGEATVAGLYALGNYPQGALPALRVTAAVQLPREGQSARTRNLRNFDGPLPVLLSDVLDWTVANLDVRQTYQRSGHMRDELEMPARAIREAIANALVHRDLGPDTLGTGRSVDIRITGRGLFIMSPGGLRGVTLSQITSVSHARAAVNQRLYALATHLRTPDDEKVIEGEGGGVTEILRAAAEADLKSPTLVDNGVEFKAILWRGTAFTPEDLAWLARRSGDRALSHLQKRMLLDTRAGAHWDVDRMRQDFSPLPQTEAEDQLRQLVRWGLLDVDLDAPLPTTLSADPGSTPSAMSSMDRYPGSPPTRLSANSLRVLEALDPKPRAIGGLAEAAGLSVNQARYALRPLLRSGTVVMDGGQGQRSTVYRRL